MSRLSTSTALLKELRSLSGAPIGDCKKALTECASVDEALDWLRKKGAMTAAKKAERKTSEGLVGVHLGGDFAALVEVNSETDFVARNERFHELVHDALAAVATHAETVGAGGEVPEEGDALLDLSVPAKGTTLRDALSDAVGAIRENLGVRRAQVLRVDGGSGALMGSYVHKTVVPFVGSAAAVVALRGSSATAQETANKLAMHVVAASPRFLDEGGVPDSVLDAEKSVIRETLPPNKPADVVDKIVQGRLRKWYGENCLLRQAHLVEESGDPVDKVLRQAGLELDGFAHFKVGA